MGQVVTDAELASLVARDREAGRTVAFANGCFDVLHVGHIRYLAGAAREADRLIVAINDDESERALKGPGRPLLPAEARAELVAALRVVDYVVLFPERSVERLLVELKPDVHCKGTDYTVDTVPERETVRAYGGRIAIVGDPKDHSTKGLIARLAGGVNAGPATATAGLPTEALAKVGTILIVRLGSLGDLVHTLPAVAAIRRAYPGANIDWLVDAVHQTFLERVPIVTSIVPLRDRTVGAWLEVRRTLRAREYDVAIDFQGLLKSAALARLSGARRVVGFDRPALREGMAAPFYTERVTVGEGQHVVHKNLQLAASLNAPAAGLEFPIATPETVVASAFLDRVSGPYALLNPGAAWPNKRWPPDRLAMIARALLDRHGLLSVVLWGPGEQDLAQAVVVASHGAAMIAPETSLIDLLALAREARLMVSGDTGPTHIAAALGVPVVALFGPTNPLRNGPWAPDDISISRYDTCDCHYERRCRRDDAAWCLGSITVDEVLTAVEERLRRAGSARPA